MERRGGFPWICVAAKFTVNYCFHMETEVYEGGVCLDGFRSGVIRWLGVSWLSNIAPNIFSNSSVSPCHVPNKFIIVFWFGFGFISLRMTSVRVSPLFLEVIRRLYASWEIFIVFSNVIPLLGVFFWDINGL